MSSMIFPVLALQAAIPVIESELLGFRESRSSDQLVIALSLLAALHLELRPESKLDIPADTWEVNLRSWNRGQDLRFPLAGGGALCLRHSRLELETDREADREKWASISSSAA